MQKKCKNMHRTRICNLKHMQLEIYATQFIPLKYPKYSNYIQGICKNMQNMQSRFAFAKYAKICTPHFADDASVAVRAQ